MGHSIIADLQALWILYDNLIGGIYMWIRNLLTSGATDLIVIRALEILIPVLIWRSKRVKKLRAMFHVEKTSHPEMEKITASKTEKKWNVPVIVLVVFVLLLIMLIRYGS